MNFYKRIIEFCTLNIDEVSNEQLYHRIININILNVCFFGVFLLTSITSFLFGASSLSLILLGSVIVAGGNFFYVVRTRNVEVAEKAIIGLIFLSLFSLFKGFGKSEIIIAPMLLMPVALIIIGKLKANTFISILFLIISVGLFLFPGDFIPGEVSLQAVLLYVVAYIGLLISSNLYLFAKDSRLNKYKNSLRDTRNTLKSKEEFISRLSHQIRTPLNNIVVITNMVSEKKLNKDLQDLIDTIHASTNNLVNVVNNIVEVTNFDVDENNIYHIDFNLYSTINNTLKLFDNQYDSKVSFHFNIAPDIDKNLKGDPIRLKQIFLNLIENILKNKISNDIEIEIDVTKNNEIGEVLELLFLVRSNKPIHIPIGINQNKYITNPKNLRQENSNLYIDLLDLDIAKRLVEINGGRLNISSSDDGTVFSFIFSLERSVVEEPQVNEIETTPTPVIENEIQPTKLPEIKPSHGIKLEQANVLLVEDNLINQKIVVLSLKKLVNNIDIANNGKEALDKFGTTKYDIILMDIQMPIMNGIVTTKKIREVEASTSSHTPIVAITANALLGDKEECLAAGMDDYISKPYQIEVLIKKMEKQLAGEEV